MTEERLSTREAAQYLGVCKQRIAAKIAQGHFNGVSRCECGLTVMIPVSEISADMKASNAKRKKRG